MKYITIAGTGKYTDLFIKRLDIYNDIQIVGLLPDTDSTMWSEFYKELSQTIKVYDYETILHDASDVIFALEFRSLIPEKVVKSKKIINCHAGILPKYRGFSSNAWAIMNGEKYIGYSLHLMNQFMDDGLLYFVKRIPISTDQTYSDVHPEMIKSILYDVPGLLLDIIENKMGGVKQEGERIYGHKFSSEMGLISDFNLKSDYFVNLYRCMAKPLGTGIRILYRGEEYFVDRVSHGKEYGIADYFAIPGKIVNIVSDDIYVKTQDNVIILDKVSDCSGKCIDVQRYFQIGTTLS